MTTVAELLDYYVNLLIIQYNNQPKMRETISEFVEQELANNLTFQVRDGFDLNTAVGVQLDSIGKYVGIDRFYEGQSFSGVNFGFVTYANETPNAQTGFADHSDVGTKAGKFVQYKDVVSGGLTLGDDDYRIILKLKVVQNNINHSHKEVDDSLFSFFGDDVRADSTGGMVMNYFIPDNLTALIKVALTKDVLPRPMGVGIGYLILKKSRFFGFATYQNESPPFITGFADYSDVDTKTGEMLKYNKLLEA